MVARIVDAVLRARGATLLITMVLSAAAAWSLQHLRFNGTLTVWLRDEDPELASYQRFVRAFETSERVVVAVMADDVFVPDVINGLHRLSEALLDVEDVREVQSLTRARILTSTEPDIVDIDPLVPRLPVDDTDIAGIRSRVTEAHFIGDRLVSASGQLTAIVVKLEPPTRGSRRAARAVRAIRRAIDQNQIPNTEVRLSGPPVVTEAIFRYAQRDFARLGAAAVALVFVITWFMFRSLIIAALPLVVVSLSSLWVFGAMGALGIEVDLLGPALLTMLFAVAVTNAVHLLSDYHRRLTDNQQAATALSDSVRSVIGQCTVTTLTTAVAMLTLTSSRLGPVARFGSLATAGVLVALVLSMTLLPALLFWLPTPPHSVLARARAGVAFGMFGLIDRIAALPEQRRYTIVGGFGVCIGAALLLLPRLQITADPTGFLAADDPVRQQMQAVERDTVGSTSLELIVETPPDDLRNPALLRRLAAIAPVLAEQPAVVQVRGFTDGLIALNDVLTGTASVPLDRAVVSEGFALMTDEPDLDPMVTPAFDAGRFSARAKMTALRALVDRLGELESDLQSEFAGPDVKLRATGIAKLIRAIEAHVVDSLISSLSMAAVLISVLMVVVLGSLRWALLSMLPNLGPVFVGLGLMALLGVPLDPATAMVGSLTLGLIVDHTIHLTLRFKAQLAEGLLLTEAVPAAVREAGPVMAATSLILASAFGVLAFGSFVPNTHFGLATAMIIGLALFADLLVLPAALLAFRSTIRWS